MNPDIIELILISVLAIIGVAASIYRFWTSFPGKTKQENIKQFLRWACAEAERELGSGTGQLKLRYVYNLAIERFPWIATMVSFDIFSSYVDESLVWLNDQIEKNQKINAIING